MQNFSINSVSTIKEFKRIYGDLPWEQWASPVKDSKEQMVILLRAKIAKYLEQLGCYTKALAQQSLSNWTDKKLFVVQMGGRSPNSMVEIHDVAFVVGRVIEEAYPALVNRWFGTKTNVHIDSILEIQQMEDYRVNVGPKKPGGSPEQTGPSLFFVNLGSYFKNVFGEFHRYTVVTASTEASAYVKACRIFNQHPSIGKLVPELEGRHIDDSLKIDANSKEAVADDLINIAEKSDFRVSLQPTERYAIPTVQNTYLPINMLTYSPEEHCSPELKESMLAIKSRWMSFVESLKAAATLEQLEKLAF